MGVPGGQDYPSQTLQTRIRKNNFHQPFAEPLFSLFFYNEYISEIGKSGFVGYHPRKPDLSFLVKNSKA